MEITYHQITADALLRHQTGLMALIQDAVADGASIGFIAPMSDDDAHAYWEKVQNAVASGEKIILIALDEHQRVAGSIQLENATFPNGHHRAEVQKLLVHRDDRNRGIAKMLLNLIEQKARDLGKWLLVLDTVEGSVAQGLYLRSGYSQVGIIPEYALSSAGVYEATVIFYKNLNSVG
jgi:acetyltransferase